MAKWISFISINSLIILSLVSCASTDNTIANPGKHFNKDLNTDTCPGKHVNDKPAGKYRDTSETSYCTRRINRLALR